MGKRVLFVMLDGVGDPNFQDSALRIANKPVLDGLTKIGKAGLIENKLDKHPDSGISQFVILGYDLSDYPGRGLFDAFRVVTPRENEIYLRANFATVEKKKMGIPSKTSKPPKFKILDRRAGREETGLKELAKKIDNMVIEGARIRVYKSVGHRVMISLRGKNLSRLVSDADPQKLGEVKEIRPLDNSNQAIHTAKVLSKFSLKVHRILKDHPINKKRKYPANYLLLRGAGKWRYLKPFEERFGMKGAIVAGSPVTKGIGKVLGMDIVPVKGATANLKTNLANKVDAALGALRNHDFVLLHILGTDVASHDKNIGAKKGFIEKIDKEIFSVLNQKLDFSKTVLAVTGDHCTSVKTGMHEQGIFPFLIYTSGIETTKSKKFDEESCKFGPFISIDEFMEELIYSTSSK